jgi:ribosomal protein S6E (S10)
VLTNVSVRTAGQTTDSWTRTFTVSFASTRDAHTVVVTQQGDGVNDLEISATVDGLRVGVTVASKGAGGRHHSGMDRLPGLRLPGNQRPRPGGAPGAEPPEAAAGRGKRVRIALTPDDLADLQDGASITTLADDGREVSLGPEGSCTDGWLIPAHLTDLAAGLSVELVSGDNVALAIEPPGEA